jgi:hypothetical protein
VHINFVPCNFIFWINFDFKKKIGKFLFYYVNSTNFAIFWGKFAKKIVTQSWKLKKKITMAFVGY